jgi:hypothetical protein
LVVTTILYSGGGGLALTLLIGFSLGLFFLLALLPFLSDFLEFCKPKALVRFFFLHRILPRLIGPSSMVGPCSLIPNHMLI